MTHQLTAGGGYILLFIWAFILFPFVSALIHWLKFGGGYWAMVEEEWDFLGRLVLFVIVIVIFGFPLFILIVGTIGFLIG